MRISIWLTLLPLVFFTQCSSPGKSEHKAYLQEFVGANLPKDVKVISEVDSGRWIAVGKYQLPQNEITGFMTGKPFIDPDEPFWWLSQDKQLDSANRLPSEHYDHLKYLLGYDLHNSWKYTINDSSGELWVELQYRDHEGTEAGYDTAREGHYSIDSSQYTIIPCEPSGGNFMFVDLGEKLRPATLTAAEVDSMQGMLMRKLSELQKRTAYGMFMDLTKYKRQYVAYYNSKGEKEVWINFFCEAGKVDWRRGLIFVMDGGSCYFNLKINLSTHLIYQIRVNGVA